MKRAHAVVFCHNEHARESKRMPATILLCSTAETAGRAALNLLLVAPAHLPAASEGVSVYMRSLIPNGCVRACAADGDLACWRHSQEQMRRKHYRRAARW
jgi:hypothetical protein